MSSVLTIPNILTCLRMALIPVFATLIFYGYHDWALFVFFFAGVSDGFDGFIARRFNQQSELGTILDPIADKLLMTTAFVILTLPNVLPHYSNLPIPFWVTAAVIGRDVLIVVVAMAIFIMTEFRGFKPSIPGKISTVVQLFTVGLVLIAANFSGFQDIYLPITYIIVTIMAFYSGIHYIFHVAKLMNEDKRLNNKEKNLDRESQN